MLGDGDGKVIASISPMAFGAGTARFFETLLASHPEVKIAGV